jgi:hypothetical protein
MIRPMVWSSALATYELVFGSHMEGKGDLPKYRHSRPLVPGRGNWGVRRSVPLHVIHCEVSSSLFSGLHAMYRAERKWRKRRNEEEISQKERLTRINRQLPWTKIPIPYTSFSQSHQDRYSSVLQIADKRNDLQISNTSALIQHPLPPPSSSSIHFLIHIRFRPRIPRSLFPTRLAGGDHTNCFPPPLQFFLSSRTAYRAGFGAIPIR